MKLEFKIFEINENRFKNLNLNVNEFIKVGEVKQGKSNICLLHHINDEGIRLINGLDIQTSAYMIERSNVKFKGNEYFSGSVILDIPKKYLTIDIIEEIKLLNE